MALADLLPKYECLLFDVDDTLYPLNSGLSKEITKNILDYMVQKLGIDENKVLDMNRFLYSNYGTSMAGLKAIGYDFDYDDYHRFVHGRLPYEALHSDYVLRNLLLSLPLRKVIFSNGDKAHVAKVLSRLGLEGCFDEIICFETLNPPAKSSTNADQHSTIYRYDGEGSALPPTPVLCKPHEIAFELALKRANINPHKTVGTCQRSEGVDFALESIHNMKEALPELWHVNGDSVNTRICRKVAIETSVVA